MPHSAILVFDNNVRPVINTVTDNHSYLYADEQHTSLEDNHIFHPNPIPKNSSNDTLGFVSTCTDTYINDSIFSNDDTIESLPSTSPIVDKLHTRGIYKIQLQHEIQNDGGANRSVTNCRPILHNFKFINPYPIGGVNNSTPAIYCTGYGYIKWYSPSKYLVLVPCYFSEQASGTIISPTDIVFSHIDVFSGWQMTTNIDDSTGLFTLLARDGVSHIRFPTFMKNNLWFHHLHVQDNDPHSTKPKSQIRSVVRSMTYNARYELWHHRLGHPGKSITEKFPHSVIGVPPLRPPKFHACGSCLRSKFHNKSLKEKPTNVTGTNTTISSNNEEDLNTISIGQFLHMDYGFVRGSDYTARDNDGKLVTSIDKYRAYLLIIDRKSRYIWIFLTKTKEPPLLQVKSLLSIFKPCSISRITTDQGGELASSKKFVDLIASTNYILTPTGSYSSAQNGLAETPNKHLAQIMRNLLYSAGLGSHFWSYAMRHSVYLKNRWPHSSINYMTPYEALHGVKPNLSHLRIFGSIVHIKSSDN